MQHFCNHGYIFERRFSPIFLQERIIFMIWVIRDYVKDGVSSNKGVIPVIPKIAFMMSRDRKCVGGARKWRHAVRIMLAIILVFT